MPEISGHVLDRRIPISWDHVLKHPLRASGRPDLTTTPLVVEKILDVPRQYREAYDQGVEGACVGFSQSWGQSILNRKLYDALTLYHEAQKIDEWPETPPEGGTSLKAGFDVLRTVGHWRFYGGKVRACGLAEGILENKWATTVDEIRACIAAGIPVNFGVNWYRQFSRPEARPSARDAHLAYTPRSDYWIGLHGTDWGVIDGGHDIEIVGASDFRQAVCLCNTWGQSYPFFVWMPYESVRRLLAEHGEAGMVTDRPKVV